MIGITPPRPSCERTPSRSQLSSPFRWYYIEMSTPKSEVAALLARARRLRNTARLARQLEPVTWLTRRCIELDEEASDLERQAAAIVQQQQAAEFQAAAPSEQKPRSGVDVGLRR